MRRAILAFMMAGTGLLAGSLATTHALASDKPNQAEAPSTPSASPRSENSELDPAQRIDKAIAAYELRSDQDLDLIRREIARQRKELTELSDLQIDLAVSLAELQAEIRVLATSRGAVSGDDSPSAAAAATNTPQERQRLRAIELARELRNVQESLRALVQQKRNETDQVVIQLRNLRAQQRQMTADAGRSAQAEKPSRD
jgi:hypothetical protein